MINNNFNPMMMGMNNPMMGGMNNSMMMGMNNPMMDMDQMNNPMMMGMNNPMMNNAQMNDINMPQNLGMMMNSNFPQNNPGVNNLNNLDNDRINNPNCKVVKLYYEDEFIQNVTLPYNRFFSSIRQTFKEIYILMEKRHIVMQGLKRLLKGPHLMKL